MGREKTILLGLLGLLAGVFVGALSLKLLVPRPPTGAGPDIRVDVAAVTPHERVEPPAPTGGWDFAAAPPLVPDEPGAAPPSLPELPGEPATEAAPLRSSGFATPPADAAPRSSRFARPGAGEPPPAAGPLVDTDVTPVAWQRVDPAADLPPAGSPAAAARATAIAGDYVVQAGDSWWGVAERAYGDGRLYRALFAWNRSRDPRVTLAPGTRLDVPPLDRLEAAWPRLAAPR